MFKGFKIKNSFEGELDKPNNVFDAKSCHVGKIKLHNRNMKRFKVAPLFVEIDDTLKGL